MAQIFWKLWLRNKIMKNHVIFFITISNLNIQFCLKKISTLKLVILFLINVINYMDRYVLFGIVSSIQNEFQIGKAQIGLLQTVFIISYMIFSLLAGCFGDRYDRKIILALSLISWSVVVFWSRLILNELII